jgi:hypothetical protein
MDRSAMARSLICGLGAVAIVMAASLHDAEAREPRPYCFQGGRGTSGGMLDCSYHTWAQCMAMVTGGGEGCSVNPELRWRALEGTRARGAMPKYPQAR